MEGTGKTKKEHKVSKFWKWFIISFKMFLVYAVCYTWAFLVVVGKSLVLTFKESVNVIVLLSVASFLYLFIVGWSIALVLSWNACNQALRILFPKEKYVEVPLKEITE